MYQGWPNRGSELSEKLYFYFYILSKHKMTRYVRNLGGMVPLSPWLRLWLPEKNEKERTILS